MVESTVNTEEWALRLNKELTEARTRIAALEERLAEAKAENERLGSAIEAMEYSDGDASFWRHIAEKNLSALEAAPPAPKVTEAMVAAAVKAFEKTRNTIEGKTYKEEIRSAISDALIAAQQSGAKSE